MVSLAITIEVMKILSAAELDGVMCWLFSPPYPWCSPSQALLSFPAAGSVIFAVEPRLAERVDVSTLMVRWSWAACPLRVDTVERVARDYRQIMIPFR